MKVAAFLVALITAFSAQSSNWIDPYKPIAAKLIAESQASDFAWRRLAELTDTFGHRLSGSDPLEKAIDWAVAAMKKDGLENVRKEPVMVPKWVRGRESSAPSFVDDALITPRRSCSAARHSLRAGRALSERCRRRVAHRDDLGVALLGGRAHT